MQCSQCGKEMLRSGLYWFCGEHDPPRQVAVSGPEKAGSPWHLQIAAADSLWYEEAFTEFPAVIAHEYHRLRELFHQGQVYGVLLQLKDIFEVLIKFPVLVAAAESYGKKERGAAEARLLALLLQKPLSLGDWQQAAALCSKKQLAPAPLDQILSAILIIFNDHKIVNWRNSEIGHGALGFADTEEFAADIKGKLALLCNYFREHYSSYQNLQLYVEHGGGKTILKGREKGRNIDHTDANVYLTLPGIKAEPLNLFPYLLLDEKGLYFFDSRDRRKGDAHLLNYPEGKKKNRHPAVNRELKTLQEALEKGAHLEALIDGGSHFDGAGHAAIEEAVLNKLAVIDDFQRPDYLADWLNKTLTEHDRGLFLLQTERGTGKSTFVRALDQLAMAKEGLLEDKMAVRAYYINDTFNCKLHKFAEGLADALRKDNRNQMAVSAAGVLDYNSAAPQEEMARFLNDYHTKRREIIAGEPEKLLLIIDGLDEIPAPQGQSLTIFDFIPHSESLNEGLYILLTARTAEDLKGKTFTLQALDKLPLTNSTSFERHSEEENSKVLRAYIEAAMSDTSARAEDQLILLRKADHRFLYLKLLKEMIKLTRLEEITEESSSAQLMEKYLTLLEEMYGTKYFKTLLEQLIVFSILPAPVTITELALLLGDSRGPSFRLLAALNDLRGFLSVERSYRRNLLYMAHDDWKQAIKNRYDLQIREKVQGWSKEALHLARTELPYWAEQYDGESYLLAWIWPLVEEYLPEGKEELMEARVDRELSSIADDLLSKQRPIIYRLERVVALYGAAVAIREELDKTGRLPGCDDLAKMLMNRAGTLAAIARYEEALLDYGRAIMIKEELDAAGRLPDRGYLALALSGRASMFTALNRYEFALSDNEQALAIIKKMDATGHLLDRKALAVVLLSRVYTLNALTRYEEALFDCDQAVTIIDEMGTTRHLLSDSDLGLAMVLLYRANILNALTRYEEALFDYDRALEITEKSDAIGRFPERNNWAIPFIMIQPSTFHVLINRANTFHKLTRYEAALIDYDRAVEITEELDKSGRLPDRNYLATVLMNRAITLNALTRYEAALIDYDQAVAITEELDKSGRLPDRNYLATALNNRASTLKALTRYEAALIDYGRAVEITEELDKSGRLPDRNYLANVLNNRASALNALTRYEAALIDYDWAVEIREELDKSSRLPDRNYLATVLMNRAITFYFLTRYEDALNDFKASAAILETIPADRRFEKIETINERIVLMEKELEKES